MTILRISKYIFPLIAVILYVGCITHRDGTNITPPDPKQRWLEGEPCTPPCWENIHPGVTRAGEALQILRSDALIDPASIQIDEIAEHDAGLVTWSFASESSPWSGKIVYPLSTQTIRSITLIAPDLCLGEIIDSYTDPEFLFLVAYQLGTIDLVWQSDGFVFEVQADSPNSDITPDTCNGALYLFPANTPFQHMPLVTFSFAREEHFAPWTGYGTY